MIDRSQKLQELIDDNPGIQFREIMRSSGLKNGVLSHYLKKLEESIMLFLYQDIILMIL